MEEISNCCGASVINETYMCSECFEHCDIIDVEKEEAKDEFDQIMDLKGKTIYYNGKEIVCNSNQ